MMKKKIFKVRRMKLPNHFLPGTLYFPKQKLLPGVQMLHGTVFSKRVPLAAGGKVIIGRVNHGKQK
jgi:hypothetical protein